MNEDFHTPLQQSHDPNFAWYLLLVIIVIAVYVAVRAWFKHRQHEDETPSFDTAVEDTEAAIPSRAPTGDCQVGACGTRATHSRPRFEQVRQDLVDRDRRRGYKPREFMRVTPGAESDRAAIVCRYHHDRAMGLCEQWNEEQRLKDVAYATEKQRMMHAFERWGVIDQMERELIEDNAARRPVEKKAVERSNGRESAPVAAALISRIQDLQ